MINESLFTSDKQDWQTPQILFDDLNKEFKFTFDSAATPDNALCAQFSSNSLNIQWVGSVFCNPPYGRELPKFIKKAREQGKPDNPVVLLIPARPDTHAWHDHIFPYAKEIRFIKGRIVFRGAKAGAPFPSAIIVFNGEYPPKITTYIQPKDRRPEAPL